MNQDRGRKGGNEQILNLKKEQDLTENAKVKTLEGGGPNVGVHSAPGWSGIAICS